MCNVEHPEFSWLALVPAILLVFYFISVQWRKKDWLKWGSENSNKKIIQSFSGKLTSRLIMVLALLIIVLAAINPRWGYKAETVEAKTADVYLLLDISNSMLAEDAAPNRLERARRFLIELANRLKTERTGLILFAGNAYLQSPLTTDWNAIRLFLNAANPDQAGTQGTAIGKAIQLVLKSAEMESDPRGGIIVIVTDGEDHDGEAVEAMEKAEEAGWTSIVVGVGSEDGGTIPMTLSGEADVKRDEEGKPVVTKLNRSLMMDLASRGGGSYYELQDESAAIEGIMKALAGVEKTNSGKRTFTEHRSYYQWFLLPAIVLILFMASARFRQEVI